MMLRKLDEFMVKRGASIDPRKFKDVVFELFSIPSFDHGNPEIIEGHRIGSTKKIVEPNDILLSKIVPHIRRCWVVPKDGEYSQIASSEWIQFRSSQIVPEYLRLFLLSDPFHSQFMKTVTGVGGSLLRASPARVAEIEMPVPNLDDQIRIAHMLGKVERLIAKRKQHLEQLDTLLRSVFQEMFGDPVRNEKMWEVRSCESVVTDISSGSSYGGEDRPFAKPDEIAVLKISAVTKGTFDPSEFKVVNRNLINKTLRFVRRGDFLFSRANTLELVAACCVVAEDYPRFFLPDKLWVLSFDESQMNQQYFNYLLKNSRYRDVVRSLASGGHDSMLNISMKKFRTLDVPCPPIGLQNRFAFIVEKVECIKSDYKGSLTELDALYGVLSQRAFKGELDLSRVPLLGELAQMRGEENEQQEQADQSPVGDGVITPTEVPHNLVQDPQPQVRNEFLAGWLAEYLTNSSLDDSLGPSHLIESAWRTLNEVQPGVAGEALAPALNDYDALKDLVFRKLASGELSQTFDGDRNWIALQRQSADWGTN